MRDTKVKVTINDNLLTRRKKTILKIIANSGKNIIVKFSLDII